MTVLTPTLILSTVACYLALLACAGWRAERSKAGAASPQRRKWRYGLSLAALCTAWTYFGAVGEASKGSWLFLANALGPILAITLGYPLWRRIAELSKQENVGSLADFLAARYGKSRTLGILVTLVALVGALPYIALQLAILTQAWSLASGYAWPGWLQSLVLVALLAGFAILFGARRPSLTQHSRGFVSIIAIESMVKLAGLVSVAILAVVLFAKSPMGFAGLVRSLPPVGPAFDFSFFTMTVLCTVTAFTLPRQFHLGFVTLEKSEDIKFAVWIVPAYFLTWAFATLLIAGAIRQGFGIAGVDAHLQVLGLPLAHAGEALAMFALLGGLSAGAAMVIVETTAVSAMVSNEILLPLAGRLMHDRYADREISSAILLVRRGTIVAIALMAWLYFLAIRDVEGPTRLGQIALSAFAQLLPALVGGIYWRRGHARGALTGIIVGMAVWAVAIAGPALTGASATAEPVGRYGTDLAILASLVLNALLYVAVSLRSSPRLIDTIQANSFVSTGTASPIAGTRRIKASVSDVERLLGQFLGEVETHRAVLDFSIAAGSARLDPADEATPHFVRSAERLLAGAIGAPSARNVIAIALSAENQDAAEISSILDEAGHAVHFSRELLQTTLDTLPQGVGVFDRELRLVAWNTRFLELAGLALEQAHVGMPVADLVVIDCEGSASEALRTRLDANLPRLQQRAPFAEEISPEGSRTFRVIGAPLGLDDYLLTIADITDLKLAERILAQSNEELEERVTDRTRELAAAKLIAEQAKSAQQRFVAAASHDLVQPLHAARLFIGNALMASDHAPDTAVLLEKADIAVDGAHRLLRALLNLSQLETGALRPTLESVDAGTLLTSLAEEFAPQAQARGLGLVVVPTNRWVLSDRDLLRSILQNLMLNALRYTAKGRVVVAARRAGRDAVRFEVRDTGVGISSDKLPAAFGEYSRIAPGRSMADGAGLGLSIVARISQMLEHPIAVRSRRGEGSVFSITVPASPPAPLRARSAVKRVDLAGMRVLCIDDERDVLLGTKALIERWGGAVTALNSAEALDAVPDAAWLVAIADYHLGGEDGLSLLRRLGDRATHRLLVTATPEDACPASLSAEGIVLMAKPLAPLELRAVLQNVVLGGQTVP